MHSRMGKFLTEFIGTFFLLFMKGNPAVEVMVPDVTRALIAEVPLHVRLVLRRAERYRSIGVVGS